MSKLTRQRLLKLIEDNRGPEGLDLAEHDLSGLELGTDAIQGELHARGITETDNFPVWVHVVEGRPAGVNLRRVNLSAARMLHTNLHGARLWEANLQQARLSLAVLEQASLIKADLRSAALLQADLRRANLQGADLRGALLAEANAEGADFRGADLREANLGHINLAGARLEWANLQGLDLSSATSISGTHMFAVKLERTNFTKNQLGRAIAEETSKRYYRARESYLNLKNNFDSIGRYDDASWAYVKERQMGKMMNDPRYSREYYGQVERIPNQATWRSNRLWRFYLRHTGRFVRDWIVELVCGYGESVHRALCSLVLLWFLAAVYYRLWWGVLGSNGGSVVSFRDYLVYSLGALTTTGFEHLRPRLDVGWVPTATALEALMGIFLAGLLGFVAANRIRRS